MVALIHIYFIYFPLVFSRARSAAPCVVFLDELDSLAPNRGAAGDSGGVMDRVVSQLLAEMDDLTGGGAEKKPLFILAATNRPDLIDKSLLRPGRFDKLLYVGPYVSTEDKASVLKAQTKNFNLKENVTINHIASIMKHDMTGADIYSICSNAWLSAVRRTVSEFTKNNSQNIKDGNEDEHINKNESENENKNENETNITESISANDVYVSLEDFHAALQKFVPTISKKDMLYYDQLRYSYNNK